MKAYSYLRIFLRKFFFLRTLKFKFTKKFTKTFSIEGVVKGIIKNMSESYNDIKLRSEGSNDCDHTHADGAESTSPRTSAKTENTTTETPLTPTKTTKKIFTESETPKSKPPSTTSEDREDREDRKDRKDRKDHQKDSVDDQDNEEDNEEDDEEDDDEDLQDDNSWSFMSLKFSILEKDTLVHMLIVYLLVLVAALLAMSVFILSYHVIVIQPRMQPPVIYIGADLSGIKFHVNSDSTDSTMSSENAQRAQPVRGSPFAPKVQWKRHKKRDSPNNNIGNWTDSKNFGVTLDECKARCAANPKCKGIGFNPKHRQGSYCVMKHTVQENLQPWNGNFYVKV